jgi:hypothetical protein
MFLWPPTANETNELMAKVWDPMIKRLAVNFNRISQTLNSKSEGFWLFCSSCQTNTCHSISELDVLLKLGKYANCNSS